MKIVSLSNLARGSALIEYAYSGKSTPMSFDVADIVGMVAAYIGHGENVCDMHQNMSERLSAPIADDMTRIFETFNHWEGRGLWFQGPAVEDIRLTNDLLQWCYPSVERRRNAVFDRLDRHFDMEGRW